MNLENARQSTNVELDCLGVRTRIDSPAAEAAFACQAEVSALREKYTNASGIWKYLPFFSNAVDETEFQSKLGEFMNSPTGHTLLNNGVQRRLMLGETESTLMDKDGMVSDPELFKLQAHDVKEALEKIYGKR